jgi:tetratricopeptide (TPR) repeat protein
MPTKEQERILALYDEAMASLRSGDLERAEELCIRLKDARFSGAFEVLALVALERGDLDAAEKTLREGTGVAPNVWFLWQLLGNTLSDRSRYAEAHAAYARALACPHVSEDSVRLNRAILFCREGRHAEALEETGGIAEEPQRSRADLVRVQVLSDLDRWENAIVEGQALVEKLATRPPSEEDDEGLEARARAALAVAWWRVKHDAEGARAILAPARLASGRAVVAVCDAEGTIDPRTSPRARTFALVVRGLWPEPMDGEQIAFLRRFTVVADDADDALARASLYVVPAARASLAVDECEDAGAAPTSALGVRRAQGYVFFGAEHG